MGTRNLTAVYIDGAYRVAQYGQWDGYPEGQGKTCLEFARTIVDQAARENFATKVRACQWATKEYIDGLNRRIESGELEDWQEKYPELSRDTGGGILERIMNAPEGIKLKNDLEFAADSLFASGRGSLTWTPGHSRDTRGSTRPES